MLGSPTVPRYAIEFSQDRVGLILDEFRRRGCSSERKHRLIREKPKFEPPECRNHLRTVSGGRAASSSAVGVRDLERARQPGMFGAAVVDVFGSEASGQRSGMKQ